MQRRPEFKRRTNKRIDPVASLIVVLILASLIGTGCSLLAPQKKLDPVSDDTSTSPSPMSPAAQSSVTPETSAPSPKLASTVPPLATQGSAESQTSAAAYTAPRFPDIRVDHIVIVVEENHAYKQIVGSANAPFMNALIGQGALFTNAYAITHPSQPNYLALFSGSTQGVKDDGCNKPFRADNLAAELLKAKLTFTGYSEDLPKPGFTGCWAGGYGRKHNPWVQFSNVPAKLNQPFSAFPKDFAKLPTVSFAIPNHQDDMHDGTVQEADQWLKTHIGPYAAWAKTHRSLLIVTWDEDDNSKRNQIPVILFGSMIKPGNYAQRIDHYNVLRTIEDLYRLPRLGASGKAAPITKVWK